MACFRCSLLYEVEDQGGGVPCPSCGAGLVAHEPDKVFDLERTGSMVGRTSSSTAGSATTDSFDASYDSPEHTGERTMLLGDLDKAVELLRAHSQSSPLVAERPTRPHAVDTDDPPPRSSSGPVPPRRANPPPRRQTLPPASEPSSDSLDATRVFTTDGPPPQKNSDLELPPTGSFEAVPSRRASQSNPPPGPRGAVPPRRKPKPKPAPQARPTPPARPTPKPKPKAPPPQPEAAAPGPGGEDEYFERSNFVHVPDAIGDLLRDSAPAPPDPARSAPARMPTQRRKRGGVPPARA